MAALVLFAALGFRDPVQFFRSYLFAFVFWIGLPLGCSAILMLHNMIGGTWGFPLRRPLESGTKTFFLMAVLVLPILFRLPVLYSWADPAKVQADPLLQYKHPYLNVPFFVVAHRDLLFRLAFDHLPCSTSGRGSRMRRAKPG